MNHGEDEDDYGEEKKIAGGSFGRCGNGGRNGEMRSSRYSGLEKEESGMFSYENRNQFGAGNGKMNGYNGSDNMGCAEIHDGKVSLDQVFYLLNYFSFGFC